MKRRRFLLNTGLLGCAPVLKPAAVFCRELTSGANAVSVPSRKIWLNYLQSLSEPVLKALSNDELLLQMPVEGRDAVQAKSRANFTHLEAFGRLLSGIAPWLQADLSNVEKKSNCRADTLRWPSGV